MPTFTENIHTTPTLQEFIDKNPNTVLEPTKALYAVDTMRLYQGDGTNKLKDIVPFYYREELNVKISNDVSKVPFFEVGDTIIATTSQINKLYEYNLEETQDMVQEATKKAEDDNTALEKKLTDKITETETTLNNKIDDAIESITEDFTQADTDLENKLQEQITENKEYTDAAIEELKKKLGLIKNPDGSTNKSEILPVGFVYVRFAGMPAPSEMFAGTWSNISSTFAGMFFRAEGGAAATFGSSQNAGLPNLKGRIGQFNTYVMRGNAADQVLFYTSTMGRPGGIHNGATDDYVYIDMNANRYNNVYQDNVNEVRPYNSTIQIWRRTK